MSEPIRTYPPAFLCTTGNIGPFFIPLFKKSVSWGPRRRAALFVHLCIHNVFRLQSAHATALGPGVPRSDQRDPAGKSGPHLTPPGGAVTVWPTVPRAGLPIPAPSSGPSACAFYNRPLSRPVPWSPRGPEPSRLCTHSHMFHRSPDDGCWPRRPSPAVTNTPGTGVRWEVPPGGFEDVCEIRGRSHKGAVL